MEPNFAILIPSVALWTIALTAYVVVSLMKAERGYTPIWTWPGLFIASLVGGSMIVTIVAMLLYPFYYLLSL
jgi:hypothetical protein